MDVHAASRGLETKASNGRGTGRSGPALPLYFSLPVLLVESLCLLNASDDSSCPWATGLVVVCAALPHHPSLPLLACSHVPGAAADGPSSVPPQCFCTCCSFSWMPLVCLAISLLDAANPSWRGLPRCTRSPPHRSEETLLLLFSVYDLRRGSVSICLHVCPHSPSMKFSQSEAACSSSSYPRARQSAKNTAGTWGLSGEPCFCPMTTFLFRLLDKARPVHVITISSLCSVLPGESASSDMGAWNKTSICNCHSRV